MSYSFRPMALLASAAVVTASAPAVAKGGDAPIPIVSPWRGGAVPAPDGHATYCAIEATYGDGTVLAFAETQARSLTLVVRHGSPASGSVAGAATVTVEGSKAPFSFRGAEKPVEQPDGTLVAIAFPDSAAAFAAIKSGAMLRISHGRGDVTYQLAATGVALRELSACAARL